MGNLTPPPQPPLSKNPESQFDEQSETIEHCKTYFMQETIHNKKENIRLLNMYSFSQSIEDEIQIHMFV